LGPTFIAWLCEIRAGPRYVLNFPTKRHWRDPSQLEDVQSGLEALARELCARHIQSVALPALGCGLGGLSWSVVRPLIEREFGRVKQVRVLVFEPG
jgi:O-acetyl-ADP-ribose deacetylase (regulator of RNase III)